MEKLKFKKCEQCEDWVGMTGITHCMNICGKPLDTLEEFNKHKALEEQKRLIQIPCAVGDTVYTFSFYKVLKMHVECFIAYKDHIDARLVSDTPENPFLTAEIDIAELGKRWFLTESEAETEVKNQ